jgi:DNA recombination protein RmuC
MGADFIIIIAVLILGFAVLAWLLVRELSKLKKIDEGTLVEWLKSMQSTIEHTNKTLNEAMRGSTTEMTRTLQSNSRQLNERLDEAARVIGALNKNVGEMSEVGRGIRSLQEFLQSPKLRGNIGEQVLKDMIGQTFPKQSFHLQYAFKSGMKVDAVLKTDAGLLCIDSKFPMENFSLMHKGETETVRGQAKRDFTADVKKHISDISKKYILPEEGTMDFALMYIPSESVYYEIANMNELMEYARGLRVYPVSPNTLYAHLQVLLLSFQGKDLEQKSRELFRLLRAIQKDYGKVEENLFVLGKHITNAYNGMSSVTGAFQVLGQKLNQSQKIGYNSEDKKQSEI